jgi:hypothetical protein
VDHLGLAAADDGLGEGVAVGVAYAADEGLDANLRVPLAAADRQMCKS